jgi:hypothetical protein
VSGPGWRVVDSTQEDGGEDIARHAAHPKYDWNGVWSSFDESAAVLPGPREAGDSMAIQEAREICTTRRNSAKDSGAMTTPYVCSNGSCHVFLANKGCE